jgi:anti-sigma factor RsiW
MTPLGCDGTLERLHSFHDGELPVGDQIAVGAHVEWCGSCAAALAELQAIGGALQALAHGRAARSGVAMGLGEEAVGFNAAVVARVTAEREASAFARVRLMFDDLHLVYAGFGAAVSTMTCVIVVLGMLSFANAGQPDSSIVPVDSLAAMQSSFANLALFECDASGEAVTGAVCRERRMERARRANEMAAQDAVFALELIVTQPDRLGRLQRLKGSTHRTSGRVEGDIELIEGLLDAVSRSSFEARPIALPASSSIARVVTSATFRAGQPAAPAVDVPLPPMKKPTA